MANLAMNEWGLENFLKLVDAIKASDLRRAA
jgi:hypothetical protein